MIGLNPYIRKSGYKGGPNISFVNGINVLV